MIQLIRMAYRDLGRNRRRSFFSALAVALGLAMLLLLASFVKGEMTIAIDNVIRLQSGHLQVRAREYDENKSSLKWEYLVENPDLLSAQIAALPPVKAATPRLFASGFVSVGDQSAGSRIYGIDPLSEANAPYREGIISGEFLTPVDREGILLGKPLAEKLGLKVGDRVNLSVNTANGDVDEQPFIVRGIYSTDTFGFDSTTVFLPLSKAQAIARAENHASTILVLLQDTSQTDTVVAALQGSAYEVLTWQDMNKMIVEFESMAGSYMGLFYMILLAIVATVVVNTLIMSVFERTREIGILSSIGMRSTRILSMFLAESSLIAFGGIFMGMIIGGVVVGILTQTGFYIGQLGMSGILITDTIYPKLTLDDAIGLSFLTLIVTLLAGLYPAILAARLEPVEALRAEK
jgi:ABC-type lipoprotein release transport system permease subunit